MGNIIIVQRPDTKNMLLSAQMVLLYKDPNGDTITENTITQSVKDPASKLNSIPSQIPRSGNDGVNITRSVHIELSQNT